VLEKSLGYTFRNKGLLAQAMVHRSHAHEQSTHEQSRRWKQKQKTGRQVNRLFKVESNERLEFLGDSVVGLVAAELAFSHYGHANEGVLTDVKSMVVNNLVLAEVGSQLGLAAHLQTSAEFATVVARNTNDGAAPKVVASGAHAPS